MAFRRDCGKGKSRRNNLICVKKKATNTMEREKASSRLDGSSQEEGG